VRKSCQTDCDLGYLYSNVKAIAVTTAAAETDNRDGRSLSIGLYFQKVLYNTEING